MTDEPTFTNPKAILLAVLAGAFLWALLIWAIVAVL